MFGSLKVERKRMTRLAKRMKAHIDTQRKVIRGVKEQLAQVVKEQMRKTKQRNEMDKMKEIEQKKEVKEKKEVEQKRRKIDYLSTEKRNVKEDVHLKSPDEKKIIDADQEKA